MDEVIRLNVDPLGTAAGPLMPGLGAKEAFSPNSSELGNPPARTWQIPAGVCPSLVTMPPQCHGAISALMGSRSQSA
jgi:hypothetical protein